MVRKSSKQPAPSPESTASLDLSGFRQPPQDAGVALDQLSAAFAGMLSTGDDPYSAAPPANHTESTREQPAVISSGTTATSHAASIDDPRADRSGEISAELSPDNGPCEITPRTIFEAMLFVGSPRNEPLSSRQVAALMRGVRAAEIDALVRELNRDYKRRNCPYEIVAEGTGYRLALREEFARVRDTFHGKARQARLSQAAIEVLSVVAYQAPITADEVSRLRGKPSGAILSHLVRRQLLGIEHEGKRPRRTLYRTTPRFLELFGLATLEELPRSHDLEEG